MDKKKHTDMESTEEHITLEDKKFLRQTIAMAKENGEALDGGPFAAIIVKEGTVIARGCNHVTPSNDPTAHAEVTAIREACRKLGTFQLEGCTIYASCEPCPMCMGAIYWARLSRIVFAADQHQAAAAGFDDAFIYKELASDIRHRQLPTLQALREEGNEPLKAWVNNPLKKEY